MVERLQGWKWLVTAAATCYITRAPRPMYRGAFRLIHHPNAAEPMYPAAPSHSQVRVPRPGLFLEERVVTRY